MSRLKNRTLNSAHEKPVILESLNWLEYTQVWKIFQALYFTFTMANSLASQIHWHDFGKIKLLLQHDAQSLHDTDMEFHVGLSNG